MTDPPESSSSSDLVQMNLPRHFTLASLVGLGLGAALGIVAHQTESGALLLLASVVEPFGALWTDALRMMVIPLVVSFVFVSVTSFDDIGKTGRFGGVALTSHLGLMAIGTALAVDVDQADPEQITYDISTGPRVRITAERRIRWLRASRRRLTDRAARLGLTKPFRAWFDRSVGDATQVGSPE